MIMCDCSREANVLIKSPSTDCNYRYRTDLYITVVNTCSYTRTQNAAVIAFSMLLKIRYLLLPLASRSLKGQSHEKVGELRVWRGSLGPN
jgi:hypothetical protein